MGQDGINLNAMRLGPGKHLHGLKLLGDVIPQEFDYFHELVIAQEMARGLTRGYSDGLGAGLVIGLPPVMNYCKIPEMRSRIMREVLTGEKFICLAITEAFGGSDVANIQTYATKSSCGKFYIVNGHKVDCCL